MANLLGALLTYFSRPVSALAPCSVPLRTVPHLNEWNVVGVEVRRDVRAIARFVTTDTVNGAGAIFQPRQCIPRLAFDSSIEKCMVDRARNHTCALSVADPNGLTFAI